ARAPAAPASGATTAHGRGGVFDRLYVGIAGGLDFPDAIETSAGGADLSADLEDGGVALLTIGRYFGTSLRGELELGYRPTSIESATAGGVTASVSGDADVATLMVNGLYDIDLGGAVKPYLGVGLGVARLQT